MIEPDPGAVALANVMLAQDDTQREILSETIEAANSGNPRESGRTYCAALGSTHGPIESSARSIDLRTCVVGRGGIWHTHPGDRGLSTPINSLPDMANVVFGDVDASIVPGTDTADVIVAPEDRKIAQAELRRAIGADVQSPGDVRDVIMSANVDPVEARERARAALSGLLFTADTGYTDLSASAPVSPRGHAATSSQAVCACTTHSGSDQPESASECLQRVDDQFEAAAEEIEKKANGMNISGIAISAAVGNVVGEVVNRVLFD